MASSRRMRRAALVGGFAVLAAATFPHDAATQAPLSDAAPVQNRTISLRFRNKAPWLAAKLGEPGKIETFGYCGEPVLSADGGYSLPCNVGVDGKAPLRIRGFKTLLVDGRDGALDDRLEVVGYAVPYPPTWKRSVELVAVAEGRLADVLATRLPLTQVPKAGAECGAAATPTVTDIVNGTLRFPEPPCQPITIALPANLSGRDSTVIGGCLPGSNGRVPLAGGKALCWRKTASAGDFAVAAQLLPGFAPVEVAVRASDVARGSLAPTFETLAGSLRPLWPYAPGLTDGGDAPPYVPTSVRFGETCGGDITRAPSGAATEYMLPTLEAAHCLQPPRAMTITLQRGSAPNGAAAPPPEAFLASYEDTISLEAGGAGSRRLPVEQLKRVLPVAFAPDDAAAYERRFGVAAGNLVSPGVYLFPGDCAGPRAKFVRFDAKGAPEKWPVSAAVFDGTGDEPLTRCARAEIAPGPTPFFTFRLEAARAAGPRRPIVIANSQRFSGTGGSSKALSDALLQFAEGINDAYRSKHAPLSPINVYYVNGRGDFVPLFKGEEAAFDLPKVKDAILSTRETVAPMTPSFDNLWILPGREKEFDRVTVVMDGSDVPQSSLNALTGLVLKLNKTGGHVNMLLSGGNCGAWQALTADFTCRTLPSGYERKASLLETFAQFISVAEPAGAAPVPDAAPARRAPSASGGSSGKRNGQDTRR